MPPSGRTVTSTPSIFPSSFEVTVPVRAAPPCADREPIASHAVASVSPMTTVPSFTRMNVVSRWTAISISEIHLRSHLEQPRTEQRRRPQPRGSVGGDLLQDRVCVQRVVHIDPTLHARLPEPQHLRQPH